MIKKIYLIWVGEKAIPSTLKTKVKHWSNLNPSFEVQVIRDLEADDLLSKLDWIEAQAAAITPHLKADLVRYALLKKTGGWYFDIDCEPKKGLINLKLDPKTFYYGRLMNTSVIPATDMLYCPSDWKHWEHFESYFRDFRKSTIPKSVTMFANAMWTRLLKNQIFKANTQILPPDFNFGSDPYVVRTDCNISPNFLTSQLSLY